MEHRQAGSSYSILLPTEAVLSMLSQVVGVPEVIVAVAPPLPNETETRQLLSFIVFDEQGLNLSIAFTKEFMALTNS